MPPPAYDPRFLAGVEHFNACDFYEAHEVWEELWADYQGPARRFYQGLIQVAVCLHHFGNGNARGCKKLFFSSQNYLNDYRPRYQGVDLDKLISELQACCQAVLESGDEFPQLEIDPERIPEIHLDPPA